MSDEQRKRVGRWAAAGVAAVALILSALSLADALGLLDPGEDRSLLPSHGGGETNAGNGDNERRPRDEQFVPPTKRRGDLVVLPVVFPDGSTADLVYPPKLRLAQLGLQPAIAAGIKMRRNPDCPNYCYRFALITRADPDEFRHGTEPREIYEGASGPVEVWRSKNSPDVPEHMFFEFGSWTVIIGDGNVGSYMGDKNRRIWARHLVAHETGLGFLVLEPTPPMVLSPPGDGGGPELWFSERFVSVDIRLGACDESEGRGAQRYKTGDGFGANWCAAGGRIAIYVDARDKDFVDLAIWGLRVEHLDVNENANVFGR